MKMLYMGGVAPSFPTLMRLLVLGDELCFMDRPSVTFGDWGTIGHASPMRQISTEGQPVTISVFKPPSGRVEDMYAPYIEADILNPEFVKSFLEGFRQDEDFAWRFLQPTGNYPEGYDGHKLRAAMLDDFKAGIPVLKPERDKSLMFVPHKPEGRVEILKNCLTEASIYLTSAQLVSAETDALPFTDNHYLSRLASLRTHSSAYVGENARQASYLGHELAKAVIPDEVLLKLGPPDILEYRKQAKDAYDAWATELNKFAAMLSDLPHDKLSDGVAKLIATELTPKLALYKNEMESNRDKLFGDLVKATAKWEVPTLSLAYIAGLSLLDATAIFAGLAAGARAAIPPITDFITAHRRTRRSNTLSYLIGVNEL